MPSDTPTQPQDSSDALLEQAAVLVARLNAAGSDRSAAQREIDDWVTGHPSRAEALREMQTIWNGTAVAASVVAHSATDLPPPTSRQQNRAPKQQRPPRRRYRRSAIAASLALLAGLALSGPDLWERMSLRMTADAYALPEARLSLTLDDGSRVELDADSALDVTFTDGTRRVVLLRGRAWFDVVTNPERPFVVNAGLGKVTATGTSFGVALRPGRVEVALTEGAVDLRHGAASVALNPGETARLESSGITMPEPFDPRQVTAWRRDQIEVYDAPLVQVLTELDLRHPGRILLANAALRDQRISGVFSTQDTDAALTIIAAIFDAQVTTVPGVLTIIY